MEARTLVTDRISSQTDTAAAFAAPSLQCDVVMKGGITSGIVYPPLVLELARRYRFRAIGGTSAGAIAAAVTAAAEYGREADGFTKLKAVNEWLAGGTHLLDLFQPTRATRPLLQVMLALERGGRVLPPAAGLRGLAARLWNALPAWLRLWFFVIPAAFREAVPVPFWTATVLGTIIGGAIDVVLARGLVDASHPQLRTTVAILLPVMFIGSYLGSMGASVWRLWSILSKDVPAQDFGICTGLTAGSGRSTDALTDWLHARIQALAGLAPEAPPLTVGMLRAKRAADGSDIGITLNMVTTSLSLGRSIVLPIEHGAFLFREDDMRRIFPAPIVTHLVSAARASAAAGSAPAGYLPLPEPDAIPVLMLARMSLSFPVLLSAVALYAPGRAPGEAPQRVWFSDGGITSNFPIHFFDSWLPSRPTFGVNLTTPAAEGSSPRAGSVFLPAAAEPSEPPVTAIATLPQFLGAIWDTTQNFHDNTLAALPGYRERIVQIPLAGDEGGLNLAMGPDAIRRIIEKGDAAADLLLGFDLEHHQWVRFLSFMAQFEQRVTRMGDVIHSAHYEALIASGVDEHFPYYRDAAWRAEALERLALLRAYVAQVEAREHGQTGTASNAFFSLDAPQPEGVLRVTPRG